MSRPGHPTSLAVAQAIESLRNALFREYGTNHTFNVWGGGNLLGAGENAYQFGAIEAVTTEQTNPDSYDPDAYCRQHGTPRSTCDESHTEVK